MTDTAVIKIKLDAGEAQSGADKLDKSMSNLGSTASKVALAVAAALSVGKLTQYSDAWVKVGNQIRQATKTVDEFAAVQARIFGIAQATRSDIEGISAAYQRLANSVANFGVSQADVLRVTEGLTKAFKANGASAAEVSSVLVQLGQGLGTGALQGDELRSVLESSLPVAQAIAKEFGVQTGELKKLGEQGKLTSERVFQALLKGADEFDAKFSKAIPTAADQFQVLENSTIRLVGEFNTAIGASEALGGVIGSVAQSLDELSVLLASGAAGKFGELFADQVRVIGTDVTATLNTVLSVYRQFDLKLVDDTNITTQDIKDSFLNIIPNIRSFVQLATVEFAVLLDKASAYGEAIAASINPFDDKDRFDARALLKERIKQIDDVRDASIDSIIQQNSAARQATEKRVKEAEQLVISYEKVKSKQAEILSTAAIGSNALGVSTVTKKEEAKVDVASEIERENAIIGQALSSRLQLYGAYSQAALNANSNEYEQRKAQLEIQLGEQRIREEESFQQDLARLQERRLEILNNDKISDEEKIAAVTALYEQERLLELSHEDELTRIKEQGVSARQALAVQERLDQINTMQGYFNTALRLADAFGSKSEKANKRRRRIQVIADAAAGGIRAYAENDFYTATGMALLIAANAKLALNSINNSGSSAASFGASSVSAAPTAPTLQPASELNQQKIININIADDAVITGAVLKQTVKQALGDDDSAVIINSALENGRRIGAI